MNESAETVNQPPNLLKLNPRQSRNFWKKVDKNGPIPTHRPELGPCWIWIGTIDANGYGQFRLNKTMARSHRVSFLVHHGEIPEDDSFHGICVCHHCDVRACINPNHLFPGTALENTRDMLTKGRARKSQKPPRIPKRHITKENVIEMRELYSKGGIFLKDLALKFNIDVSLVSLIVNRKRWKSV